MPTVEVEGGNSAALTVKKEIDMDIWEVSAQKYLHDVFYRHEVDAKAKSGDKYAAAIIATAAAISK